MYPVLFLQTTFRESVLGVPFWAKRRATMVWEMQRAKGRACTCVPFKLSPLRLRVSHWQRAVLCFHWQWCQPECAGGSAFRMCQEFLATDSERAALQVDSKFTLPLAVQVAEGRPEC
jgi:hypothetical protein